MPIRALSTKHARALALAACTFGCTPVHAERKTPPVSGAPVLAGVCEASALLVSERAPGVATLTVADDEIDDRLFVFTHDARGVTASGTVAFPSGARVSDIEALAEVGTRFVVVGSHSVSKKGRLAKRARVVELEVTSADGAPPRAAKERDHGAWLALAKGDVQRCGALFVEGARAAMPALCPALGIDVEGAFVDDEGRLWLGLRAPRVERRAVFLRVRDEGPGFDRSAFVDLGGFAVRDLAREGPTLFVLAGPSDDSEQPGRVYAVELARVVAGGRIGAAELPVTVPARAEGLAVTQSRIYVVTDGGRVKNDAAVCAQPSQLVVVPRGK